MPIAGKKPVKEAAARTFADWLHADPAAAESCVATCEEGDGGARRKSA